VLRLNKIAKNHPDFSLVDISFTVQKGDYFILLGESGAGKSMILETIAGLVTPDYGTLMLDDRDITKEKIQRRKIGLVFQDHAVFPHLNVGENMAYSLHGSDHTRHEKKLMVSAIANQLSIGNLLDRRPASLSGGELQRVALARTLIQKPAILLLDEPLASLDSRLKAELRALLRKLHREGQTILHVTHDYEEALSLGTKIAVIHKGSIVQEGTPEEVFHHPKTEFVAHFVGVRNFFPAHLVQKNETQLAQIAPNLFIHLLTDEPEEEGFVMIRGEDILLSKEAIETSAANSFPGTVLEIVATTHGIDITIDIGIHLHALITKESLVKLGISEGKTIWTHMKATAVRYVGR